MYDLALEQLDRWRDWRVFSNDNLARMLEVELVSDLTMNMLSGLTGKDQKRMNKVYEQYDDTFPRSRFVVRRFRRVMDTINDIFGAKIGKSAYQSQVNFFTLFVYFYDRQYGLKSTLDSSPARKLPKQLATRLLTLSDRIQNQDVPENVLDAIQRASTDLGRRKTRLEYMRKLCDVTGS